MFVWARCPSSALFTEFTINFRVNVHAFIRILAIGKEFAWVFWVEKFAFIFFKVALWPMAASSAFALFRTSS
jgi:hypothetical protein